VTRFGEAVLQIVFEEPITPMEAAAALSLHLHSQTEDGGELPFHVTEVKVTIR